MSHIVSIQTKLRDLAAITAACQHLGLPAPMQGTAQLYSGEATGLLVQLPGWQYPIAIDTTDGTVQFDHFEGRWGAIEKLHEFVQCYVVEKTRREAQARGYPVYVSPLPDGSIKLQIVESE
jgi:hypothetical protein